jgi:hypothetical protein
VRLGVGFLLAVIYLGLLMFPQLQADTVSVSDSPAEPVNHDQAELEQLLSGEVLLETVRMDESGGAARVKVISYASAEAIWAVIISCEDTFRYVRGLKTCDVLKDDGGQARVRQAVKQSWVLPRLDFTFTATRKPYTAIDFNLLE